MWYRGSKAVDNLLWGCMQRSQKPSITSTTTNLTACYLGTVVCHYQGQAGEVVSLLHSALNPASNKEAAADPRRSSSCVQRSSRACRVYVWTRRSIGASGDAALCAFERGAESALNSQAQRALARAAILRSPGTCLRTKPPATYPFIHYAPETPPLRQTVATLQVSGKVPRINREV